MLLSPEAWAVLRAACRAARDGLSSADVARRTCDALVRTNRAAWLLIHRSEKFARVQVYPTCLR